MTLAQLLEPLARHRTDEVVVSTMAATRAWGRLSDHDLDFASTDSAMGHAADLALGIALARPGRKVVCLNGDGSMLMSLGTLATIVGTGATNLILFVLDNGVFEITGRQPVPGAGLVDYGRLAEGCGFPNVLRFGDARAYAAAFPDLLAAPGPTFVHARVDPGSEGPIERSEREAARYLRYSLADWSRRFREAIGPRPLA